MGSVVFSRSVWKKFGGKHVKFALSTTISSLTESTFNDQLAFQNALQESTQNIPTLGP
jgi:hypothetical protein